jgi:hypothetical protein
VTVADSLSSTTKEKLRREHVELMACILKWANTIGRDLLGLLTPVG